MKVKPRLRDLAAGLRHRAARLMLAGMGSNESTPSREERLAAKLRENLRRRKAQARARVVGAAHGDEGLDASGGGLPNRREES